MSLLSDDLDERLRLIRESAIAVVHGEQGAPRARVLRFQPPGFDTGKWKEMCSLGWSGSRVDESRGGSGLDVRSLCAIAQMLGAGIAPEPFIAVAAIAPSLPDDVLNGVLSGDRLVLPAWLEALHSLDLAGQCRFQRGRLAGSKRMVHGGQAADAFLVATADGLALVERSAPGVSLTSIPLNDGGFAVDLMFDQTPAVAVSGSMSAAFEDGALANAAYLLGASERMFETTLGYLSTRRQFGRPLSSFQALQHRAVDMKIQIELLRAVVDEAATALDTTLGGEDERKSLVSRSRMRAASASMLVARECVQMHGAMGVTDECDIGLYARRVVALQHDWGSALAHKHRYIQIERARHE